MAKENVRGLKIVDDTEVSASQAQFLKERIDYLTSYVIKNRTEYVGTDGLDYEHMLEQLLLHITLGKAV